MQIFGVTASSIVLVAIAIDRYRNVVHVMSKKWNPRWLSCLAGIAVIWLGSAGTFNCLIARNRVNFFFQE